MYIQRYRPSLTAVNLFSNTKSYVNYVRDIPPGFDHLTFLSAREAIAFYLHGLLMKESHRREVILSPYICSSVIDILINLNLKIVFVDVVEDSIFPDQHALSSKVSDNTLAVIIAPYFGIYPRNMKNIRSQIGSAKLILDYAQGIYFPYDDLDPDAVILSYGLGKGVDYYGGSLIYRNTFPDVQPDIFSESVAHYLLWTLKRFTQAFIIYNTISYRLLSKYVEKQIQNNKSIAERITYTRLSKRAIRVVERLLQKYGTTVATARQRAVELYNMPELRSLLISSSYIDFERSNFLRFPLLPRSIEERKKIEQYFLRHNIEITSASEKTYTTELPNYNSLNSRILKLPYLGVLRNREFEYIKEVIHRILKIL